MGFVSLSRFEWSFLCHNASYNLPVSVSYWKQLFLPVCIIFLVSCSNSDMEAVVNNWLMSLLSVSKTFLVNSIHLMNVNYVFNL